MRRLRDRMREDLALRRMRPNTIDTYVRCARRFAEHFGRSPCAMGASEVRAFLLYSVRWPKGWPTLCQTDGSGAARNRARNGRLCFRGLFARGGFGLLTRS